MTIIENLSILKKEDKKNFLILIFLGLLGTFFEVLGVGIIVPLALIITDPLVIENNIYINNFVNILNIQSRDSLIIISLAIVISIYSIKLVYLTYLSWRKNSFCYSLQQKLSTKVFEVFLRQPYIYYSNLNSSRLIQDTKDEPALYCSYVVLGYIDMLSEILIILGITILLLSYSFFPSLILFTFIILIVVFYEFIFKKKTLNWAKQKKFYDKLSYNILKYVYGSIIEIKIGSKEESVQTKYGEYVNNNIQNIKKQFFMTDIPRLYLEFFAIFLFMLYILFAHFYYEESSKIITTSALYAVSAFKILPSLNRIVVGIQKVNFGRNSYLVIKNILNLNKNYEIKDNTLKNITFQKSIEVKNLFFAYKKNFIINDLSLKINSKEIVGIKGRSGEGKTTLINLILGLLKPNSGRIIVDAQNVMDYPSSWQKNTSYAPQKVYILDDTIKKNICFEEEDSQMDENLLKKSLSLASLDDLLDSLPDGLNTNIGENGSQLSGGQIQRIGFARAIYKNPKFLICDEITSSLDKENEDIIINSIKKLSKEMTILLITHKEEPLKICDKVYELKDGDLKLLN